MAHRQGLNDSSTNIHGGAVRVGRVLEGALARAAVRNGKVVDLHADAGAVLLAKRSVQIAPKALADFGETARRRGVTDVSSTRWAASLQSLPRLCATLSIATC